jgi:hypothetical protein
LLTRRALDQDIRPTLAWARRVVIGRGTMRACEAAGPENASERGMALIRYI